MSDSSPHKWKVLALDNRTGKILWEKTAHEGIAQTKAAPEVFASLAFAGDRRQSGPRVFRIGGLYAYSMDGTLLGMKDLGVQNAGWFFDPDSEWGAASSPVIYGHMVIVQCDRQKDSFIAAFDLKDGNELWRTARAEIPTGGTPAVVQGKDRVEVATNGAKAIRGYDAATGKQLWTLGPNSEVTCTTPVSANGLIFSQPAILPCSRSMPSRWDPVATLPCNLETLLVFVPLLILNVGFDRRLIDRAHCLRRSILAPTDVVPNTVYAIPETPPSDGATTAP